MVQKKATQKTVQKTAPKTVPKTVHSVVHSVTHKAGSVAKSTGKWLCQPRISVLGFLAATLVCSFFPVPAKWAAKIGYIK